MKNSTSGKVLYGNWKGGWSLDQHMAIYPRRTEIGEMLYQLKYNQDKSKIEPLANKAFEFMKTRLVTKWLFCIVPVPPSDNSRIFQPVIEIAKLLGKKMNIPINYDCLLKVKTTEFMKDNNISAIEKEKKLKGVYKIKVEPNNKGNFSRVTDAIKIAGGITEDANIKEVEVIRKSGLSEYPLIKTKIDLHALITKGNTSQNLILFDGDVIKIPKAESNLAVDVISSSNLNDFSMQVYVIGEVQKPGVLTMNSNSTLIEAVLN